MHWAPFFAPGDRRLEPAQAVELSGYRPVASAAALVDPESLGIQAEQDLLDDDLLSVLTALSRGDSFIRSIQARTNLTDYQVRACLARGQQLGFITRSNTVSEAGMNWALDARHEVQEPPIERQEHYYPSQLRGANGV